MVRSPSVTPPNVGVMRLIGEGPRDRLWRGREVDDVYSDEPGDEDRDDGEDNDPERATDPASLHPGSVARGSGSA